VAKPLRRSKGFARLKPVKDLINPAISYWLPPHDEETARALAVPCPICNQPPGLPCFRERSKPGDNGRRVLLFRPHWQRVRTALGEGLEGARPNGRNL